MVHKTRDIERKKSNICRWGHSIKKNSEHLLTIILLLLMALGFFIKYRISMQASLSSDDIFFGIVARELWQSGFNFFKDFFFFSADPDLFTGFPIYVLPQIVSGYSSDVLRITSFLIFIAIIVSFSIVIYHITSDKNAVLIFASLTAVGTPAFSLQSVIPKSHFVTILGISFFLYLLFIKKWTSGKKLYLSLFFLLS